VVSYVLRFSSASCRDNVDGRQGAVSARWQAAQDAAEWAASHTWTASWRSLESAHQSNNDRGQVDSAATSERQTCHSRLMSAYCYKQVNQPIHRLPSTTAVAGTLRKLLASTSRLRVSCRGNRRALCATTAYSGVNVYWSRAQPCGGTGCSLDETLPDALEERKS
jgi:hypothetical protein